MDKKINKCGCGGEGAYKSNFTRNFIECTNCGNSIEEYNGLTTHSPNLIEAWNTAHPEISNAQQAIKWLEEGKKIKRITEIDQLLPYHLERNKDGTIDIKRGEDSDHITLYHLLCVAQNDGWKLYEEPKYKKLTTEKVLTDFALNGRNKHIVITLNDGNEYCIVGIDECHLILRNSKGEEEVRPRGLLKNGTWKFYYE